MLELFIYGCAGIAKYVAEQIGVQERGGSAYYLAALPAAGSSAAWKCGVCRAACL